MEHQHRSRQGGAQHPAEVTPLPRESRAGVSTTVEEVPGIAMSVRRHGTTAAVRLAGELDAYTSPQFDDLCREMHTSGVEQVEVDLAGTTFMDSSGLRALLSCHRRMVDTGGSMRVSAVSEPVLRLLVITGLDEHFGLSPDAPVGTTITDSALTETDP